MGFAASEDEALRIIVLTTCRGDEDIYQARASRPALTSREMQVLKPVRRGIVHLE